MVFRYLVEERTRRERRSFIFRPAPPFRGDLLIIETARSHFFYRVRLRFVFFSPYETARWGGGGEVCPRLPIRFNFFFFFFLSFTRFLHSMCRTASYVYVILCDMTTKPLAGRPLDRLRGARVT